MKVLLINGSPHKDGCTNRALEEVAKAIEAEGIETEIYHIGTAPINGCVACGYCGPTGQCICDEDGVNFILSRLSSYEGIVIGSPVHYAGPAGNLTSFLDRLFYAGGGRLLAGKPGAAVVSARRSGTTASFDRLNKYFTISNMPVVPSQYWNGVHGSTKEDVEKDLEGLQTMRTLGINMAWMVKCFAAAKAVGIEYPGLPEEHEWTNFIR